MAKCLVLGGDGFIGAHLVRRLLLDGHEVSIFSKNDYPANSGARRIYGDFLSKVDIDVAVRGHEYVFHFITLTNPAVSDLDPFIDIETNVGMTIHLLESCVAHKVKRVIFPSSGGAIYGDNVNDTLTEEDATFPVSPYAIGKQSIEGYLRFFYQKYNLDYLTLRISNVYGIGQHTSGKKHGVISVFMDSMIKGQPLRVFGDGAMVRDYIYVDDLVLIVSSLAFRETQHKIYNVGSGVGVTVNEIIEQIEHLLGMKAGRIYMETPSTYVDKIVLDCSRLTQEFGGFPKTSLEDGIESIYKGLQI